MSQLRYDPVFGQWTCIAENRQSRPFEFQQLTQRRAGIDCPFCRGNESATPPPVVEWDADGPCISTGNDWLVRVLPNKYPAMEGSLTVVSGEQPEPSGHSRGGHQEVIVLSPRHVASLSGLSDAELFASFAVFQSRMKYFMELPGIRHTCLFMNCRPMAGASIEHSHFQLIASPVCTGQIQSRIERMTQVVAGSPGRTVWQELLMQELDSPARLIERTNDYAVYCPFASRYSNQIRIAPMAGIPFSGLSASLRDPLAKLCRKWVNGIERCLDDVAYNVVFHLPPSQQAGAPWFVDLIPRFPQIAGFELATDCWVNPVSPETAAGQYREFSRREEELSGRKEAPHARNSDGLA